MRTDAADLTPQPLATATALPARFYTGEATADLDQRAVFDRHWQYICHASQIGDEGDYTVAAMGRLPVIVIRTADGLRGYHNVCRHRAGPLAHCPGKGAKQLRCKYHGWTYNLDGSLRTATEMKDVADFDIADVHLPEVQVREFEGLVFAAASNDAPSFEAYVEGIAERLAVSGHRLADLRFHQHLHYDIDCNWKTYVDNYLEGYHVPHVHPELNKLLDYRSYVTETKRWYSMQFSPLESGDDLYGSGEALYYFMYPNTMLNILPGRLQTNRVLPLPGNRCRVEFDFFYVESKGESDDIRRQRDLEFSDVVQDEDIRICIDVQKGLDSGSYHAGRLNPLRENALHHFQELLRADYRAHGGSAG